MVIRGGYGVNYDPYPLAFVRDLLGNYPSGIGLTRVVAERVPVRRPSRRRDPGRDRAGCQQRHHPGAGDHRRATLDPKPKRGYIHSWNLTVQKELPFRIDGSDRLRRHAPARHQPDPECERRPGDRRRRCRPAVLRALSAARRKPALLTQRRLERLRLAADVAAAPVLAGAAGERRIHLVAARSASAATTCPTTRRRSRRWTTSS